MTDTSNTAERPRGPGRPSNAELAARQASQAEAPTARQAETQKLRRRRAGSEEERSLKLFVPESMKDPNFSYRWVNDRAGRVRQMTVDDDWDVVDTAKLGGDPDPSKNTAEGTVLSRVGDKFTGERMTLLRKPKEFYDADRKAKADRLDAVEAEMRRKPPATPDGVGAEDRAYIPGGRNIVGGR